MPMKSSAPPLPPGDVKFRYKSGSIPEDDAILPSKLFFFWARFLFRRAAYLHKHGEALQQDDLLPLPPYDESQAIAPIFQNAWKKSSDFPEPVAKSLEDLQNKEIELSTKRIQRALAAVLGKKFIIAGVIKFCNTSLQFSFPLLLNAILKFIEDTQSGKYSPGNHWHERYRGYWLSIALFLAMACKAITENAYFLRVYRAAYNARVAVSTAVYNKSLKLANAERQSTTLGELINLMQVDATKIEMFCIQIHVLWDGVLQILGYMVILYTLIGWPCFIGLIVMMAAGPVQGIIMRKLFALNRKMVRYTDARVKTTNEALQGIQCVKMYTWEDSFEASIGKSRSEELGFLRNVSYLRGASRAYMTALPGIVAVTSFVVYALARNETVKASTLFAALVAFDQLRFPLLFYPMAFAQLAQAKVSAARVEVFLRMKEIGKGETVGRGVYERNENTDKGSIILEKATVFWNDPSIPIDVSQHSKGTVGNDSDSELGPAKRYPKPILNQVSLTVSPGQLCAVVGPVASGKSTLCSAILHEALLDGGTIKLNGKVAYAAQSPWILNATLRDNILFGQPFDAAKYNEVIRACQLTYDLQMLEDGDMTEIGERGINLSGGQKQRVSVARAAYSDADTIILDDPLSALDPEVAKRLFEECVLKLLKGRTILLVTNQLQFLQYCDNIVALRDGTVIEQGSYAELMELENGEVKRLLAGVKTNTETQPEETRDRSGSGDFPVSDESLVDVNLEEVSETKKDQKEAKALMAEEERMIGAVAFKVYKKYFKAGGGYLKFIGVLMIYILSAGNQLAGTSWVSFWTSDPKYVKHSQAFYLGLYFVLAVTLGFFAFLRAFFLVRFGVAASKNLHNNLLNSVLHAPQSFFDTTPIGRIVSRFSKDFYSIDIELTEQFDMFVMMTLSVLMSIGSIIFITPWFGIAVIPLGIFYFRILNYFRDVSREAKRLESISRSPVYAHFSETLGGLSTIRAYGESDRFFHEFDRKLDQNTRAYYCTKVSDRWLSVRLETIGATIAGLAGVFASNVAISGAASGKPSASNFASLAGLSLSYAISMTSMLNWCVRTFAQTEAAMNSVERVAYYTENIPQEAPFTSADLRENAARFKELPPPSNPSCYAVAISGVQTAELSSDWPQKGEITMKNLRMRYRSDTPLVLKGLNITINGGERIGVVGRTGSGKSSLLLTLLRLVEPALTENEPYESPLSIDGVDVLRIGLKELRSKVGIIPQNPVLFSGTIRSNLDPFGNYTDEQIWDALNNCGMKSSVLAMPGELSATVAEYGENLSAGMRQMLVLGRALLRQCRVLLLDEATSSVDFETDRAIQRTIREAFRGCTVITIAHRINTILDSDRVLVMRDGHVAEFAPPNELLKNPKSLFFEIVHHSKTQSSSERK